MKTTAMIIASLFCFAILTYGQSTNTIPAPKASKEDIPEYIRNSNQYKRAEWFTSQRAFPYDTIPVSTYYREVDREMNKANINRLKTNDYPIWTSVGPRGFQHKRANCGVVSGRVRAVAIHPNDPETLYIGAASGGLWKSTNGGISWSDVGYGLESMNFGAIAIDPNNPEIIYAGSGESVLLEKIYIYPGKGLFKSSDGGQSWTVITNGFGNQTQFSDLEVSPYNSNIVLASLASGHEFFRPLLTNEGIWRSLDAGITWSKTLDLQDPFDIAFHPSNPDIVYAAVGGINKIPGFFISNDQGATWVQSNSGLMLPIGGRIQFDISRSSPNIIYAVIYDLNTHPDLAITRAFKSIDGGASWAQISAGTQLGGYKSSGWYDQGWYDLCIAVDPVNPDHVLIGTAELHRTTDGSTFTPVRPFGSNVLGSLIHEDYHRLVYAPSNPNILYIGNDGGLYKSADKGYTASSRNTGLSTLQFYRIASHPSNPEIFMGGIQDDGQTGTVNGGASWKGLFSGDGTECFFDRLNPDNVLYASNYFGFLYKSINGGTTWNTVFSADGSFITPYFMHPANNNVLYTANKKIYKSINAGATFEVISGPADVSPVNICTMAQSQVNPDIMIFGTGENVIHFDSVFIVKVSKDEGKTWSDVTGRIPGKSTWISRVVTDPVDSNTMYVVRTSFSPGNKVYKTVDLGQTWTNISGDLPDLPTNDLFIDPENTSRLFVANDIGVYLSTDGGTSWNYASEGMPVVPAMDFDYVKIGSKKYLRVGTYGRSVYETNFTGICQLENVTFSTQTAIDNFQTAYPDCQEIKGEVTITGSDIKNLAGLSSMSGIGGNLTIRNNPELTSLAGLDGLTSIRGSVLISSNHALTSLAGLPPVNTIDGDLHIEANNALNSLAGLESLSSISGRLVIIGNSSLTSLNDLESISSIGGIVISGSSMTDLKGLEPLSSIDGSVAIENNSVLTNLTALESVSYIGGDLSIKNNAVLSSLKGLENIDPGSIANLTIRGNNELSACEVMSLCNYLARPGGTVEIQDNATGCNSQAEVEKACLTSSESIPFENEISIFPNPGKGLLIIAAPKELTIEQVVIYNSAGQEVQHGKPMNNSVDISNLRPGIYFVEIRANQLKTRKKFVVE